MSSIGRVDGGSFHPADGGDNTPAPATGSEAPAAPPVTDRSGSGGGLLDVLSGLSSRVSSLFSDDRTDAAPAAAPHRPVTVSPEGRFTTTPGAEPGDLREVGAGLFAAASKIDDGAKNLFDVAGIDSARRGQILANLRGDLAKVPAGGAPPAGLDPLQADQLRSSGATVLLELMSSPGTPESVQREAFDVYHAQLTAETQPILRDSMALHLVRLRAALPADLQPTIDAVEQGLAPQAPPYAKWFEGGNDTVKVDWIAQSHQWELSKEGLLAEGYELVSESGSQHRFQKTYEENGVETTFEVTIRQSYARAGMYDGVAEDDHHMHVYTGHSDWGRYMRRSLEGGPDSPNGGDGKLVLTSLCAGKGEVQLFRDKFPDAHLVTSHNSTKFSTTSNRSEGVQAFLSMARSIARREGYDGMAAEVKRNNPFRWNHDRWGIDNNYLFPDSTAARRQVLDRDHDGQADPLDRLVDFSTFDVAEDTSNEFVPVDGGRPAEALVGTKAHFAAMNLNRMAIFSDIFEDRNSTGDVLPGGFFEPTEGEAALCRFDAQELDGDAVKVLSLNRRYAHMSEEALRMATSYEYALHMADTERGWNLDDVDSKLNAMVFAAHSLYSDYGYRDSAVWDAFVEAYNLPDLDLATVQTARKADSHAYSGSRTSIRALREALTPDVLAELAKSDVGRFRG